MKKSYIKNPFKSGTVFQEGSQFGYYGKDIYGKFHQSPVLYPTRLEAKKALDRQIFNRGAYRMNPAKKSVAFYREEARKAEQNADWLRASRLLKLAIKKYPISKSEMYKLDLSNLSERAKAATASHKSGMGRGSHQRKNKPYKLNPIGNVMIKIMLKTKADRNGNFKRCVISFGSDGGIRSVELNPSNRSSNLELPVSPSVINEMVSSAKRHGVYKN